MSYRNKYVDTLKFFAIFIVFFTHYINRFGDQYRYIFYDLPSSIVLYGVSGKMGVAFLGVIMGWLAYESKRDIAEAIIHRYCFFFVSVLLINVFYNIWNCSQGTDFSIRLFVQSCLLLDDTFFPALWFIKDFFLAYVISILNKCGKIKMGGVLLEIIILLLFNEVWVAVCLFGNVYALLRNNKNVRLKMILKIWWVQCFILIGAFIITKRSESFVTYILDGISCAFILIVLNENKILSTIFSNKLTSFMGEHSWGFFLVHALIYNIIGTKFFKLDDYMGCGSYSMRFTICFVICFVCNILLSIPLTIGINKMALLIEKMIKRMVSIASVNIKKLTYIK